MIGLSKKEYRRSLILGRLSLYWVRDKPVNNYFWRTQDQQEIDYIEEMDGVLHAYEVKWNPRVSSSLSKTFSGAYPNHTFSMVHPANFDSFLGI